MVVRAHLIPSLLLLSIAMTVRSAHSAVMLPQNLEDLEAQSQLVFVGVCTSRTETRTERGLPVDVYTFEVREAVKGLAAKDTVVVIRQLGAGRIDPGGLRHYVPELPTYRVGQELLLFLSPASRLGLTSPVGFAQGAFEVTREDGKAPRIVLSPLRRRLLVQGIDRAKYAEDPAFTPEERSLLSELPGRADLDVFCSVVRKMAQQ